jgi:competence protein ComEA
MRDESDAPPDPRAEMESLGYDVVYKPHEVMAKYNAFYNVEYDDQRIAPPAARRMGVPLNEVWLTEFLAPYERYVLHHELNEIRYRAAGYDVETAHERALEDDRVFEGDPKWDELWNEINLVPPRRVTALPGFGETLFERIQNHRPYCDMAELRAVPGIGPRRHELLCEAFWCFDCDL